MSTGKTALAAVQTAIMATLGADAPLAALVPGGVWDYVPPNEVFPYLCVESAEEAPDDTFGTQGRIVTITLAIFSSYRGRKEQYAILDALVRLLRQTTLTVTDWTHIHTAHLGSVAYSPFDLGSLLAGQTRVRFAVLVVE